MAHHQQNKKADRLANLNGRGVDLMRQWIIRLLDEARAKHSSTNGDIRVLDIGCGHSPYLNNVDLTGIDLHLWDTVDLLDPDTEIDYKPFQPHNKFRHIRFPEDISPAILETEDGDVKPFDIIILSAVLHELYQQWSLKKLLSNSDASSERDFASWFIQQFNKHELVGPDSIVVVGEIYHRSFWEPELLEKARAAQLEFCGHADPPTAFPDPVSIIHGALKEGFSLQHFDEGRSVPENHEIFTQIDEDVKLVFNNRRFAVLVFRSQVAVKHDFISIETLLKHSINSDYKLTDAFGELKNALNAWVENQSLNLREKYDTVFINGPDSQNSGIFCALVSKCAHLVRDYYKWLNVDHPKSLSFWLSVNSEVLDRDVWHGSRYIHKIGEDYSVFSADLSNSINYDEIPGVPIVEEWSALAYNQLLIGHENIPIDTTLKAPSLFGWLSSQSVNNLPPRSITITYERIADADSDVSSIHMEDAIYSSGLDIWNDGDVLTNKHLLALIFHRDMKPSEAGAYLNRLTDYQYCGNYLEEGMVARVRECIASVYLDFIFLRRFVDCPDKKDIGKSDVELKKVALEGFKNRWLTEYGVEYFDYINDIKDPSKLYLPVQYKKRINKLYDITLNLLDGTIMPRTWILLAPSSFDKGKPLADTPMFFTNRIFAPMLLNLLMIKIDKTFQSIRTFELEAKTARDVKKEAVLAEMTMRNTAIAGFSHQVGHVIGAKSNLPLYKFHLESGLELLSNEELLARSAQIRYAALLPRAYEDALDSPEAVLLRWTKLGKNVAWISAKELFKEVWDNLAEPIINCIKPSNYSKSIKLNKEEEPRFMVPNLEVLKVALFESLWNAFEHGVFNDSNGVNVSFYTITNRLEINITNPSDGKRHVERDGGDGLRHVEAMINSIAAAGSKAPQTDERHHVSICKFSGSYDSKQNVWQTNIIVGGKTIERGQ